MTVTTPTPPPLPDELDALLRRLRMPYIRNAAPELLATAKSQRWDPAEVLRVLINEEVIGRDAATRRMRRKTANLPSGKTFATWRPAVLRRRTSCFRPRRRSRERPQLS